MTGSAPALTLRPGRQWLILLMPSAVLLAVLAIIDYRNRSGDLGLFVLNFLAFPVLCFGLGLWWEWREPTIGRRLGFGFAATCAIMLVNGVIAAGGCSMGLFKIEWIIPLPS